MKVSCAVLLVGLVACFLVAPGHGRELGERAEWRHVRGLLDSSFASQSSSGQSASSMAAACAGGSCPGGPSASTSGSASGPGSTVAGTSNVNGRVMSCQQGPADSAACQTLVTSDRASECTDIAPDVNYTCAQQAEFGKCDTNFIYMDAYCLASCWRCGSNCTDVLPPSVSSCDASACDSAEVTAGPYCLSTCGRCYHS